METQKYIGEALLKDNSAKSLRIVLKDDAVTESKIKDGTITTNKLKDGCITKEKLADDISLGTTTSKDIDTINKNIETIMDELLSPEIEIDKVDGVYEFVHDEGTNQMHLRIGYDFDCKEEPIPNNGTFSNTSANIAYRIKDKNSQNYSTVTVKEYSFNPDNRGVNINLTNPANVYFEIGGQSKYKGINIIFPTKTFSFYYVYPSYLGFIMDFEYWAQMFDEERVLSAFDVKDNVLKEITSGFDDEYTIEQKNEASDSYLCAVIPKNGNVQEPADVYINNEDLPLLKEEYNFWTVFYTERKFKAGTYTFYIS